MIYFVLGNCKNEAGTAQISYTLDTKIVAVVSGIGTCLFRNNGLVIMVLFSALFLLVYKRKTKFLYIVTAGVVVVSLCTLGILKICTAAESASKMEALSVPAQQMAYTYLLHKDEITEYKTELETLFPEPEAYEPHIVDEIKTRVNPGVGQISVINMARCYLYLGTQYPADYIVAFINVARGYLVIGDTSFAEIYGNGSDVSRGYLITECIGNNIGVAQTSLLPAVKDFIGY